MTILELIKVTLMILAGVIMIRVGNEIEDCCGLCYVVGAFFIIAALFVALFSMYPTEAINLTKLLTTKLW